MKPLTLEDVIDIAAHSPVVIQAVRTAMLKEGAKPEDVTDEAIAGRHAEFAALIREDGADAETAIVAFCNAIYEAGRASVRTWRAS